MMTPAFIESFIIRSAVLKDVAHVFDQRKAFVENEGKSEVVKENLEQIGKQLELARSEPELPSQVAGRLDEAKDAVKGTQDKGDPETRNEAKAALERAKLDLEYCTIRSPIDGRTGHLLVKQGNVVKANDVDLVTINREQDRGTYSETNLWMRHL